MLWNWYLTNNLVLKTRWCTYRREQPRSPNSSPHDYVWYNPVCSAPGTSGWHLAQTGTRLLSCWAPSRPAVVGQTIAVRTSAPPQVVACSDQSAVSRTVWRRRARKVRRASPARGCSGSGRAEASCRPQWTARPFGSCTSPWPRHQSRTFGSWWRFRGCLVTWRNNWGRGAWSRIAWICILQRRSLDQRNRRWTATSNVKERALFFFQLQITYVKRLERNNGTDQDG